MMLRRFQEMFKSHERWAYILLESKKVGLIQMMFRSWKGEMYHFCRGDFQVQRLILIDFKQKK